MPISEKVELGTSKFKMPGFYLLRSNCQGAPLPRGVLLLCSWSLRPLMSLYHTWCQIFGRWNQLNLRDHQMGHWWSHNSLTETGNGMRGQKLKAAWAKAESQATWKQECENKLISSRGRKPLQKPELLQLEHCQSGGSYPRGKCFVAPDLGVQGRPQSSKKKKLPGSTRVRKVDMKSS